MSIKKQLDQDLKDAMRAKDTVRLTTIRSLRSAIQYKQVELGADKELGDEDVLRLVGSLVKQRRDAAEQFRAGGRPELAEKEEKEQEILETYLPAQLSAEELAKIVDETIAEVGASSPRDMGAVMKVLLPKVTGKADGRQVSALVKERLG